MLGFVLLVICATLAAWLTVHVIHSRHPGFMRYTGMIVGVTILCALMLSICQAFP